jgi:cysteinyl-tRNA synthetase
MLKIHNTLTRGKQEFVPMQPGKIRMYVCGITVYDDCHLGHARMLLAFDMVYRWLLASGFDVTYVRNITDVDDKIIARAAENGESIGELTKRTTASMHRDTERLLMLPPSFEPRATEHIAGMLGLIEKLIANGLAYQANNGDVYYAVAKFDGYGKLSGKSLEDLRAGERVDIDPNKRDPMDFVLWKAAKPGEPSWPSHWGPGRPGWHIECSAMSEQLLGEQFDIHGGGQDLQFPHHENEIAQSEGAHRHTFVNYWMHNGFLRVNDEKMSKSLKNFFRIDDALKLVDAEVLRFFMLRGHYRSPLNYNDEALADAKNSLDRLYTSLKGLDVPGASFNLSEPAAGLFSLASDGEEFGRLVEPHLTRFINAMNDDFNTPEAVATLFELANELNRTRSPQTAGLLKALAGTMGLLQREPREYLQGRSFSEMDEGAKKMTSMAIEQFIEDRRVAKQRRDFAEADRIRKELLDAGVQLEDTAQGTVWRRA